MPVGSGSFQFLSALNRFASLMTSIPGQLAEVRAHATAAPMLFADKLVVTLDRDQV